MGSLFSKKAPTPQSVDVMPGINDHVEPQRFAVPGYIACLMTAHRLPLLHCRGIYP